MVEHQIDTVLEPYERLIRSLVSRNKINGAEAKTLRQAARSYRKQLKSVRNADGKSHGSQQAAVGRVLNSKSAKFLATVRVLGGGQHFVFDEAVGKASSLDLFTNYSEKVKVIPIPTRKGRLRPIALTGLKRKSQQLILRDILSITHGDAKNDSTVRGFGGEGAAIGFIKSQISNGYRYWATLDIINFFPSIRPGHLTGFPFSKWIRENHFFLKPNVPIVLSDKDNVLSAKGVTSLSVSHEDNTLSSQEEQVSSMLKMVQAGLPQGDAIAPQTARTVLARELRQALQKRDVVWVSHLDDLAIGASTQKELEASIHALVKRLSSLPPGPLEFHTPYFGDPDAGIEFLGYQIRTAYGGLHVRPTLKRFLRFRERLWQRLVADDEVGDLLSPFQSAGQAYTKEWYISQVAWTKHEQSWSFVLGEMHETYNYFLSRLVDQKELYELEELVDFTLAEMTAAKFEGFEV